MWIVVVREPPPDAPYWPGREWLAVLDALAWPALGLWGLAQVPFNRGLFIPLAGVLLCVVALMRLRTALLLNHRYRFTTWRVGRFLALLLFIGIALKFAMAWR